jgi:hypothetical protein
MQNVKHSDHSKPTPALQEKSVKRRRFHKGSLQLRRRGKAKKWMVLYYDDGGHRRYHTVGSGSLTKTAAEQLRDEFMRSVNGSEEPERGGLRPIRLREFVEQEYLPFQRGKWERSTQGTSENRIRHHILTELGDTALNDFSLRSPMTPIPVSRIWSGSPDPNSLPICAAAERSSVFWNGTSKKGKALTITS